MSTLNTNLVQRTFNQLDKNGDGLLSIDELMWLLESIGVHTNQDELKLLVGKPSLDLIDFLFFYETIIKWNKCKNNEIKEEEELLEKDLREAFKVFDLNGDGVISSDELQSALSRLGLWDDQCGKDCTTMINVYDINSDGVIDFEEFKNMMSLAEC